MKKVKEKPAILFMSTFPPTECGIATYTEDLLHTLSNQFGESFDLIRCELSNSYNKLNPSSYCLNPRLKEEYARTAALIKENTQIKLIHIQHEFGLFGGSYGDYLISFLEEVDVPVVITFHTILPNPNPELKTVVLKLISKVKTILVMTQKSAKILMEDYQIRAGKIKIIPHGTHLVDWVENTAVKKKYGFEDKNLLTTFGLLGPGKNIETALNALPEIISNYPNTLYLIVGKSHPNNIVNGSDEYRLSLHQLAEKLNVNAHVLFLDHFLELPELLEILQGTDIYLFTSKDPNQAVSGTFSYAMSCGCPIIATSIPHTREMLTPNVGRLINIGDSKQLAKHTIDLLGKPEMKSQMGLNAYKVSSATCWENIAIEHAHFYQYLIDPIMSLEYSCPPINLDHLNRMTNHVGIIQFSKIAHPDINSGYTLDDNARALIIMCRYYELYEEKKCLKAIKKYLAFIEKCQTSSGSFINYLDASENIHIKNDYVNLEDSNARAVWALGTVIAIKELLPENIYAKAVHILERCIPWIPGVLSPRSIGFLIKGLYLCNGTISNLQRRNLIVQLAGKLVSRYDLNNHKDWSWYENYLTYANSVLPEAMLYAYLVTEDEVYKDVAINSFDFLLNKLFVNKQFRSISNNGWHMKDEKSNLFGEQPIEVGYTLEALENFYYTFKTPKYLNLMHQAFSWFLGNNHLKQLIYNPLTGGCHDGLEKNNVNLNQGAESTICYLMARLSIERVINLKLESQETFSFRSRVLRNRKTTQKEL